MARIDLDALLGESAGRVVGPVDQPVGNGPLLGYLVWTWDGRTVRDALPRREGDLVVGHRYRRRSGPREAGDAPRSGVYRLELLTKHGDAHVLATFVSVDRPGDAYEQWAWAVGQAVDLGPDPDWTIEAAVARRATFLPGEINFERT